MRRIFKFLFLFVVSVFLCLHININIQSLANESHEISVDVAGEINSSRMLPELNREAGVVEILEEVSLYGNTNKLTAIPSDGFCFAFYLQNGMYVTSNAEHVFTTVDDHQFLAVFSPIEKSQIVFLGANNQYLGSLLVDFGTEILSEELEHFSSKLPTRPGYEFSHWSVEFPYTASKQLIFVRAIYQADINQQHEIIIFSEDQTLMTMNIQYGKTVTITAPEVAGKVFLHWSINNSILSYSQTHTLSVYCDMDIEAIYIDEESSDEKEVTPVAYLSDSVITDFSKMYFIVQTSIPEDFTIIEQGLLYLNTNTEFDDYIEITTPNIKRIRAVRISPNNEYAIIKDTLNDHNLYVRSYMVVTDSDGNVQYVYSSQHTFCFKYAINYHLNGGTNHPENPSYHSIYTDALVLEPTKAGYHFLGWYLNNNFSSEKVTKIFSGQSKDYTLYAKWEEIDPTYYVTYNYNGGTPVYNSLTEIKTLFLQDLRKFTNKEAINSETFMNDTYGVANEVALFFDDATYKVKWEWLLDYFISYATIEEYPQLYILIDKTSVDYHAVLRSTLYGFLNDSIWGAWPISPDFSKTTAEELMWQELAGPTTFKQDTELPLITPIKSGYRFAGWYLDEDFRGQPITKVTKGTKNNLALYAKWVKSGEEETFHIDYIVDGGIITNHKMLFTAKDLPYNIPTITKANHRFLGWYLDPNFTNSVTAITTTGNKILYAKWEKIDENTVYTINYNLNNGTLNSPKTTYKVGELPLTLQTPTRSNYVFAGWYLNSNFTGSKISTIDINSIGNLVLYAKWDNITQDYSITYELNGGTLPSLNKEQIKVEFLTDYYNYLGKPGGNLTTFMHGAGNTSGFGGTWQDNLASLYAANDKSSDASKPYFINQPQYNSKWVPFFDLLDEMVNEVNATQYFWSSPYTGHIRLKEWITGNRWASDNRIPTNLSAPTKYNKDTLPLTLATPTRSGYIFLGWFENPTYTGSKVISIPAGTTGNKTFYAQWSSQAYNVTYNLNGGSWYSSKNDFKNDFLLDFYNYLGQPGGNLTTFRHGAGNSSGYDGTWQNFLDQLYTINDKSSDINKGYFINHPVYNKKWLPFFNWMETLVKETNETQSFWGSTYTGNTRLKEYMKNERYTDKTYPSIVRGHGLYFSHEGLTSIPVPTMTGGKFLGWYTSANFSGSAVTSIAKGSTGNKTLYAKWEVTGPPAGSVYLRLGMSGNGTVAVGGNIKVSYTAVVTGNYQADGVTFSSSNTSIATVDQNGNVKGIAAGSVVITARTIASGAVSQVGITVYASNTDPLLKYLISQNTGLLFTRNITYYGFNGNFVNRISNTANKYLPEALSVNTTSYVLPTSRANHPNRQMSSVQYVTVHDTGSATAASNAKANAGWCVNPSNTSSSWHYTVGNDGIFRHIAENMVAWHAGDGGSFTFSRRDSGVKATNIDTVKPKTTRSNNRLYINGQLTPFSASVAINSEGLLYSIGSNGNYFLGTTHTMNGVIVNRGGNYNSIGIEMAVNTGSNVYYTWQRTAKLVGDIMTRRNMRLPQVGFHRNFSNKMCPQTLIRAGLQDEFFRLVAAEYHIRKNYSSATITFTSSNTSILNNKGQIVKYPAQQTNVAYTIKVTYGGKTHSATLYALVPGTKDF